MKAGKFCNRNVVFIEKDASVAEAASLMRKYHVGCVVVVDSGREPKRPVGVFTDRDIVMEFVSQDLSPVDIAVGDAITSELVSVDEDTGLFETIEIMRECAVRRVPVVNAQGGLIGLVASDDALDLVTEQLSDLVAVVAKQRRGEISRLN